MINPSQSLNDTSSNAPKNTSIADPGPVHLLIAQLNDNKSDVPKRLQALADLSRLGPRASIAVPCLIDLLREGREAVATPTADQAGPMLIRLGAAMSLREIGPTARDAIPALTEGLNDKQMIAWECAKALVAIDPRNRAPVSTISRGLTDDDVAIRRESISLLMKLESNAAIALPQIIEALSDSDGDVRHGAIGVIRGMGELAIPHLIEYQKGKPSPFHPEMPKLLREIGRPAADGLAKATTDRRDAVRLSAIRMLGWMGTDGSSAIESVRKALDDPRPSVRDAARDAIRKIENNER